MCCRDCNDILVYFESVALVLDVESKWKVFMLDFMVLKMNLQRDSAVDDVLAKARLAISRSSAEIPFAEHDIQIYIGDVMEKTSF